MPQKEEQFQNDVILIADDHEIFRAGLADVLRISLGAKRVIAEGRFDDALKRLDDKELTLAIFDLDMPGLDGAHDLARVRRRRPDIRVVVLSGSSDRQDILAALEAGVHGFLVKNQRTEDLIRKLRHVLSGEIYVPPVLAQLPPEKEIVQVESDVPHLLTGGQRQVLELIAEGLSNKEMADRLQLSQGTIKMHIAATFRAIGASNHAQAVSIGRELLA